MKQRAYTLAEILIALGIIGVLAAVMLPMVNKYKPDTTKVLYLNTYDALAESVSAAANNRSYYIVDNGTYNFERYPFANLDAYIDSTNPAHRIAEGQNKLCRVLSENFNILEEPSVIATGNVSCRNNAAAYDINRPETFRADFTIKNGVEFMIATRANNPQPNNNNYETNIAIDINGAGNGNNCTYDRNNCRKPDRFTFRVSADAALLPTDEMGIRYLETRTNLKYKKDEDFNNNSQLAQDIRNALDNNRNEQDGFTGFSIPPSQVENNNAPGNENPNVEPETPDDNTPLIPGDRIPIDLGDRIPFTPKPYTPGSGTSYGGSSNNKGGGGGGGGRDEMYVDGPGYVGGGMDGIPHPITDGNKNNNNFSYSSY